MSFELHHGDCLDVIPTLPEVDAIVCDPPYSLSFMGKAWDDELPSIDIWMECLSVLRPGGYLMAFGGTRTYHRLTCSIEDAGFEIRDSILTNTYLTWVYGSGFPKSKGCLKPAWEPIVLARKPGKRVLPLGIAECKVGTESTVRSQNDGPTWTANPDGSSRFHGERRLNGSTEGRWPPNLLLVHHPDCGESCDESCVVRTLGEQSGVSKGDGKPRSFRRTKETTGWAGGSHPMDVAGVDRGDTGTAARFFPQFRYCPKASRRDRNEGCEGMEAKYSGVGHRAQEPGVYLVRDDEPDKAEIAAYLKSWRESRGLSKREVDERLGTSTLYSWFEGRPAGIELPTPEQWTKLKTILGFDETHDRIMTTCHEVERVFGSSLAPAANTHSCVKPTPLLEWLVRLACPEGGTVLDPFMGSGSTGKVCMRAGRRFVGVERDAEWLPIARARIEHERAKTPLIAEAG